MLFRSQIVWPEHYDDIDYRYEHAILVVPYSESGGINQNGHSITIFLYAMRHVMRALRKAEAAAKEKS